MGIERIVVMMAVVLPESGPSPGDHPGADSRPLMRDREGAMRVAILERVFSTNQPLPPGDPGVTRDA